MTTRKKILATVAMALALLQGCDGTKATAAGDRSAEGKGQVAFRMSASGLATLRQTCSRMVLSVEGPGLQQPIVDSFVLDSMDVTLGGIPCGTRYVHVSVLDSIGHPYWSGADTVEVYSNAVSSTDIVLHRVLATGLIQVNLRLDDGTLDTLHRYDTLPRMNLDSLRYQDSLYHYDSLRRYGTPSYDTLPKMNLDSLRYQDSLYRRDSLRLADTLKYRWNSQLPPQDS